jgi:hypothetical protein
MFYVALTDIRPAIETYENLIALAARHGLIDVEVRALIDMALPAAWISTERYIETLERTLQLSARQEHPLMRARTRARCLQWRSCAGRWNPDDAESCRKAMDEVERKGDRLVVAEHRLEYTYLQSLSSQYGDAHRSGGQSCDSASPRRYQSILWRSLFGTPFFSSPQPSILGRVGSGSEGDPGVGRAHGEERGLRPCARMVCLQGLGTSLRDGFLRRRSDLRVHRHVSSPSTAVRKWYILIGSAEATLEMTGQYTFVAPERPAHSDLLALRTKDFFCL